MLSLTCQCNIIARVSLLQKIRGVLERDGFTKELMDRGHFEIENEMKMEIQNSQPHRNWTVIMQSSSVVS